MAYRLQIMGVCLLLIIGSGCGDDLEIRVSRQGAEGDPAFGGGVPEPSTAPVAETREDEKDSETSLVREDAPADEEGFIPNYHLAITEIFYDPVTLPDAAGEWFEISNLGKFPVPMDELEVRTPLGSAYLGLEASLLPGGVALIARFPYPSATPYGLIPDAVAGNFMLPNTQGFVEVRINDEVLDRVEYGAVLGFPDPSGASLSLDVGAYSIEKNDLGSNWCPGTTEYAPGEYGTPGVANPPCEQSFSPPDWNGGENETEAAAGGGGLDEPESEQGGENTVDDETVPEEQDEPAEEEEEEWGWWDEDDWDWDEDEGGDDEEWPWEQPGGSGGDQTDALVITEVHFDPQAAPDEDGEWFELTNLSDWNLDLRGLTILDNASFHVINSDNPVWIKPYGTLTFGRNSNLDENGGLLVDYVYGGVVLNNSGDVLTLADGDFVIDQVFFGAAFGLPGVTGASVQLSADSSSPVLNDYPQYWCPSTSTYGWGDGGTPGNGNSVCVVSFEDDYPSGSYAELVISEIMYNPAAVLDSHGEWLELYNPTSTAVDIRGLMISDKKASHVIAGASPLLIGPGEYAVLARNGSSAQNGGVGPLHVYSKITLNNGGETLTLSYDGVLIDEVTYGEAEGFPVADGASMMVVNPSENTLNDSPEAWCVSGIPFGDGDGGTPGGMNGTCK